MNKLPRRYKLYIPFMLVGIALLAILPTSCSCNCSSNDGIGGDWNPDALYAANKIAFVSGRDGNQDIYMMKSDGSDLSAITNDENIDNTPIWSPSGSKIAFISFNDDTGRNGIHVMNANGSGRIRLGNLPVLRMGSWSPDSEKIAFASGGDIYVINVDGTGLTMLTDNSETEHRNPTWSPDGAKIAFASIPDGFTTKAEAFVMNSNGSGLTKIYDDSRLSNTWLLWWPDSSKISFVHGGIYAINVNGTDITSVSSHIDNFFLNGFPTWSPDGTKILFSAGSGDNLNIYVMDINDTEPTKLTDSFYPDRSPTWSPDGTKIAFESLRDINWEIYVMNADGTGQTNISNNPNMDISPTWSPR